MRIPIVVDPRAVYLRSEREIAQSPSAQGSHEGRRRLRPGRARSKRSELTEPLVAVVIPVFNGGSLLEGCIESVCAQTYSNWILVIADNVSTDDSLRIAEAAAARDDRVRVERHSEHVGMLANWNRGLAHAPADAVYVKQLNVDDRIRPDCIRRLVEVAEAHPGVGVVSSYFTVGPLRRPIHDYAKLRLVPGHDAVREVLHAGPSHLVHPSVLLLRRSASGSWPRFYDPTGFPPGHPKTPFLAQCDKEAFFDVLARSDLAFVPEVLTDIAAAEPGTATGFMRRVGSWQAGRIETILRHGDRFLTPEAKRRALRKAATRYVRSLAWRIARGRHLRDSDFALYQRLALAHLIPRLAQEKIGWTALALRLAARAMDLGSKSANEARA